jgi:hypothetical protein
MTIAFLLESFDGQPGGATYFELHLETDGQVATSEGIYPTPDVAAEEVKRLVFACQHHPEYACDVGVDPETWKYTGLFPNPQGTRHFARTRPCDTEDEARQLIDTIVTAVGQIGDQIPVGGPGTTGRRTLWTARSRVAECPLPVEVGRSKSSGLLLTGARRGANPEQTTNQRLSPDITGQHDAQLKRHRQGRVRRLNQC